MQQTDTVDRTTAKSGYRRQSAGYSVTPSTLKIVGWALIGMGVAIVSALVFAWVRLNPPIKDLQAIARLLLISGSLSVVLGAIGFRLGLGTRIPSLAWTMALVYLVGAAVVAVNVLYTAFNMFLSAHDFGLLTILLVFSAVISLFFAFFLSQSIVSRLRGLLAVARKVSDGDLSARVPVNSGDEIGRLSQEFNSMVERLEWAREERERMETSRRDLVASVSHDLRTPLASMRAMIEALNDGVVTDPETVSRYLNNIQNETQHLTTLIDDLFELSQIDAGALKLHVEPASLEDLVSDVLESMQAQAARKNVRLQGEVLGTPTEVLLDAPRMQRVLYNLVQNAIRHTPPGGAVTIMLKEDTRGLELTVSDTGEGISEADLPHVFDRFYRGEAARTRDTRMGPGAGLGLAIARGIVEAHGGTISVQSKPGEGATFRVALPFGAATRMAVSL